MSSNDSTESTIPVMFHHCRTVYDAMMAEATEMENRETGSVDIVYEGHLTRLFAKLHLSVPYYSAVTQDLKRMGCIRQLRRGGGNAPSQWQLLYEPTEELYRTTQEKLIAQRKKPSRMDMLEQQVRALTQRVGDLEQFNSTANDSNQTQTGAA